MKTEEFRLYNPRKRNIERLTIAALGATIGATIGVFCHSIFQNPEEDISITQKILVDGQTAEVTYVLYPSGERSWTTYDFELSEGRTLNLMDEDSDCTLDRIIITNSEDVLEYHTAPFPKNPQFANWEKLFREAGYQTHGLRYDFSVALSSYYTLSDSSCNGTGN